MSFPRYPTYKASGVEWLGDVPEHWEVRPLKRLARLQTGMTPPTDDWDNYTEDEGFQWVRPEDLDETGTPTKSSKFLTDKGWLQTRQIKAGASLICCIGTIGKVGITTDVVSTNQQITAAEPQQDGRYLFYTICAGRSELELASTGTVLRILNTERLGNIGCTNPPLPEQTQIAVFLDRETAKIDELVAEQRRLVELLKEKQQAVISHAVTKGLNPHAPMKPSSIEWLGDVPEYWEVWKLAHAFELIGSGTTPKTDKREYYDNGDIPWINTGDFNDGELDDCEKRITPLALAQNSSLKTYPAGSLLIAMYGATIGKLAMLRFPSTVNQACCVFAGKSEIMSKFMFYWFLGLRQQVLSLATGGGQPNISQDILRTLRVACPDRNEQTQIAAFLDTETAKFNTLIVEAQRAIDLLQERRTALISAAVTGQIDVRQQPGI